ncbi:MAG TPA: LysM peptidoglycan-binding domain-containing protein [Phycisphaerae bacterium]|nr:LysM peptidoglycan-binding domain-containing protein [Phycisphaerae bacterium]
MRKMSAWMMIVGVAVLGLALGCQQKTEDPQAQAPQQEPMQTFPEDQVPPPEPQPTVSTLPPAPPVDTTAQQPAASKATKAKPQPKESYAQAKKSSRTYVVKKGDTLQKISKQFYGTTKQWRRICNANRKAVKDCDKLIPGTKLVIP